MNFLARTIFAYLSVKSVYEMKNINSKKILDILERNSILLKKYSVRRIGLFGSGSRDEISARSDIDFLVEFDKKSVDNLIDLSFELRKLFGRKVELITEAGISPYILPYIKNELKWYEA